MSFINKSYTVRGNVAGCAIETPMKGNCLAARNHIANGKLDRAISPRLLSVRLQCEQARTIDRGFKAQQRISRAQLRGGLPCRHCGSQQRNGNPPSDSLPYHCEGSAETRTLAEQPPLLIARRARRTTASQSAWCDCRTCRSLLRRLASRGCCRPNPSNCRGHSP